LVSIMGEKFSFIIETLQEKKAILTTRKIECLKTKNST